MPALISKIVEVYPFRFTRDRVEHLLLRRASSDLLYPGMWQIVTGSIETGETAFAAAMREFREETGLTPLRFWSVPQVGAFHDHRSDDINLCALFACQVSDAFLPVLSAEHDRFRWAGFEEAGSKLVWPSQREGLKIVERFIAGDEEAGRVLRLF